MGDYDYVTLRERPEFLDTAASWFHAKWGVPKEAYLACMTAYLKNETEYGENDFHNRKDLSPNVCAIYTEEAFRGQGIAGRLLTMAVDDMASKGISPLYLVTDHIGFYERYGWQFLCMVQSDGEPNLSRMYVHNS